VVSFGLTMAQLCDQLTATLGNDIGKAVIDRTGLTESYDVHLELSPCAITPTRRECQGQADPAVASDPSGSISNALKKLGLTLELSKALREFLVIDHVERPSEN
jgi:uncharacterized protein (TIGR03435 family)